MDLSTKWLGLELAHPLVAGASPLGHHVESVKRLEGAGAAAIVLHSLFEEQIRRETDATWSAVEGSANNSAEALSYFPDPSEFDTGAAAYLRLVEKARAALTVPLVASLNGASNAGWVKYAHQMETAGASALELNIYFLATDADDTPSAVEDRVVDIAAAVTSTVKVPVSVKLSPFHSSVPHLVRRLAAAGAKGVTLFNRFYQPDIDIEHLETVPKLVLSESSDLLLRLRWLALLYGRTPLSLAATGGVHRPEDAVKAIMAGADVVQTASALLKHGPGYLQTLRDGFDAWFREHDYESVAQARGSMSLLRCPDPAAYERANYARILQTWRA